MSLIKVDPAKIEAKQAEEVRTKRNRLLEETDWTQLPDSPVDHSAWAAYRQLLREILQQPGFPENVVWPTKPE